MNTNILAPFVSIEESVQFYLNGRVYEVNGNEMKEIEKVTNETLISAIRAFESFDFSNDSVIKWYHGPSKFTYSIAENKFMWNMSVIEGNTFTDHVLHAGIVKYDNAPKARLFESLPSLLDNFLVLDFAASFKNESITVDLFKLEENIYVSRYNEGTRISKFFKANSANEAVEYVQAETGLSALDFVQEMVDGELAAQASVNAEIATYESMISFLKDQRGLLADADKSIEEIKEADTLITQEIKSWEEKIAALRA